MMNDNPLKPALSSRQTRIIAGLIVQHDGKVTNISVEVTTDDGSRVTVSSDGLMEWKRRDESANKSNDMD